MQVIIYQGGERVIEHKTYKYIIRSYEPFMEERTKTFIQALSAIKKMKLSGIKHYEGYHSERDILTSQYIFQ